MTEIEKYGMLAGINLRYKKIIFLLLLSGLLCCKDKKDSFVPREARAGDLIMKPVVFKIKSDHYNADQGTLMVQESRGKEASRLIALPLLRIRSLNKKSAEPVFYLAGGPGQSNMNFKPPEDLLKNHDFVMVGYRGVDGSVKLNCPEVKKAIKGMGGDLLGKSSLSNLGRAFRQSAERLQSEGIDLNAYTMPDVIVDMEVARTALGYDRINLLSQSYGTRIAQIYAYQHPGIIHRSVMMGVNPPGHFVWEPDTTDRQIEYYSRLFAKDPECRILTPDLTQTVKKVAHNMPRRWLFLRIDPGKVKLITFALLYHRNTAAIALDAYIAAEKGDPSGLALMSLAYDFMFPSMITWGDLAAKAISADFDKSRDYATEMDPPGSILGAPFSKLLWSLIDWPTATIPEEFRKVQQTDVETLLLSGNVDFATPAQYAAKELLPFLTNGKQVIVKEMGHTHDLWTVQRPATLHLLTSFFDTGIADDSMFTYAPMDFHVSWGFPEFAKIGLVTVLLVIFCVTGLIRIIVRKIRHRKVKN